MISEHIGVHHVEDLHRFSLTLIKKLMRQQKKKSKSFSFRVIEMKMRLTNIFTKCPGKLFLIQVRQGFSYLTNVFFFFFSSDRKTKEKLAAKFNIRGIPTLIVLSTDGTTLTTDARSEITNMGAKAIECWAEGKKSAQPQDDE